MPSLSSHTIKLLWLAAAAFTAALCVCPAIAQGQSPAGPQTPGGAPAESQPQTPIAPPGRNRGLSRVLTAPPVQPPDIHAVITQFIEELHKTTAKKIVVIGGLTPASGRDALGNWLVVQVKDSLSQVPHGFDLVQGELRVGKHVGESVLDTGGADTVVSATVCPNEEGILVTLNAVPAKPDHKQEQDAPGVLVSKNVALTDELTALLPPDWVEESRRERKASDDLSTHGGHWPNVASCAYCPDPEFTDLARKLKLTGTVLVTVIVQADGTPDDIELVRGFGFGLDEAAIEAVTQWRFHPAGEAAGNPFATKTTIELTFRIK